MSDFFTGQIVKKTRIRLSIIANTIDENYQLSITLEIW